MRLQVLVLQSCVLGIMCQLNVIRLTDRLRQQGFYKDLELGELISEAAVDSPEACGALCRQDPVCHTVMMMGQLCRLFAEKPCPCYNDLTYIEGSYYLVGMDQNVRSFVAAMDKCFSLGAHSVHVNSPEEHDMLKGFIATNAPSCQYVWTGGRSAVSGSADITDWRWYYSNDFTGPSDPFTFLDWGPYKPSDAFPDLIALQLVTGSDYKFSNTKMTSMVASSCFVCECP